MRITQEKIREACDAHWADVTLRDEQKQKILAQCRPQLVLAKPRRGARRAVALAAAACLMLTLCVGTAAASPGLRRQVGGLSEYAADQFQPVNKTSTDQGLRMEVLAAANDGDRAVIYLNVQDAQGLGRINDGMQLYDYAVSSAGRRQCMAFSEVVAYDEASQTATLRLESMAEDNGDPGRRMRVQVAGLLTGAASTEWQGTGYTVADLAAMNPVPALRSVTSDSWMTGGGTLADRIDRGQMRFLQPNLSITPQAAPWLTIEGVGLVDGSLHVLVSQDEKMGRFDQLHLSLITEDGTAAESDSAVLDLGRRKEFGRLTPGLDYYTQKEFVLALPKDADLNRLELAYSLDTYEQYLEGSWSVRFDLDEGGQVRTGTCSLTCGGWVAQRLKLTPLGVTVEGTGEMLATDPVVDLMVWDASGKPVDFYSCSTSAISDENGQYHVELKNSFTLPMDPAQVVRVTLNGQEIPLEN